MDIRGIKRPFGNLPLPVFITDLRIMGSMRFLFCDDNEIGDIEIFDAGYFSFMETILWNRKTCRRIAYRRLLPARAMKFPRSVGNSVSVLRARSRFVRILTRLQKQLVHADFDLQGSLSRPPCEGHLEMNLSARGTASLSAVIPFGVKRRCQASYQLVAPLHGWISTGFDDRYINEDRGTGFFDLRQAYFGLRTRMSKMIGLGRIAERLVAFQLGSPVSHDDSRYNDNVLFVDGKASPLPPVKITRPYGTGGKWVLQDTESMVDLVFVPLSDSARKLSALMVRTDYHTVYGLFQGVLLTATGERIELRDFPGIGKKLLLRV